MEIFVGNQIKTLVESCIMGLIFGVGYDIIRILHVLLNLCSYVSTKREKFLPAKGAFWLFLLLDIGYMLVVTFFFSVFLFYANRGQFRLYVVLPCVCGFALYHSTIGKIVMGLSEAIVSFLRRLFCILIWMPFMKLMRLLGKIMHKTGVLWGSCMRIVVCRFRMIWRTYRTRRMLSRMVRL